MPVKIQLALQGGGAKILCLIAALKAIEELETDNKLKVTRIVGTSAGAIAGALYATKIPMGEILTWFESENGKNVLKKLNIKEKSKSESKFKLKIQKMFDSLKILPSLFKFYYGREIIKQDILKDVLKSLFLIGKIDIEKVTLSEFESHSNWIPFSSTYTDILNNTSGQPTKNDNLMNALLESAGLPFVFRTYKSVNSTHVDGGICENLPTGSLERTESEYVVAIAFEQNNYRETSSILKYAQALLFTAMDNSVTRAVDMLGDDSVCKLNTDIDTLQFEKILGTRNKKQIDTAYDKSKTFFVKFAKQHKVQEFLLGDPWEETRKSNSYWANKYSNLMTDIRKVYELQSIVGKAVFSHIRMEIYLTNCGDSNEVSSQVKIVYRRRFTIKEGQSIYGIKYAIAIPKKATLDDIEYTIISLPEGNNIDKIPLPINNDCFDNDNDNDNDNAYVIRPLVLWSKSEFPQENNEFELYVKTVGENLLPYLNSGGIEEFMIDSNLSEEMIDSIEIFIVAPNSIIENANPLTLDKAKKSGYHFRDKKLNNFGSHFGAPGRINIMNSEQAKCRSNELDWKLSQILPDNNGILEWSNTLTPCNKIVGITLKLGNNI